MAEYAKTFDVIKNYKPGDPHSWGNEFAILRATHAPRLRKLARQILAHGIQKPILLGDDGRVWDGHHRLYIAFHLGLDHVPVEHARPGSRA